MPLCLALASQEYTPLYLPYISQAPPLYLALASQECTPAGSCLASSSVQHRLGSALHLHHVHAGSASQAASPASEHVVAAELDSARAAGVPVAAGAGASVGPVAGVPVGAGAEAGLESPAGAGAA